MKIRCAGTLNTSVKKSVDESLMAELRTKHKGSAMGTPGWDVNRCLNRIEVLTGDMKDYKKLRELVYENLKAIDVSTMARTLETVKHFLDDTN